MASVLAVCDLSGPHQGDEGHSHADQISELRSLGRAVCLQRFTHVRRQRAPHPPQNMREVGARIVAAVIRDPTGEHGVIQVQAGLEMVRGNGVLTRSVVRQDLQQSPGYKACSMLRPRQQFPHGVVPHHTSMEPGLAFPRRQILERKRSVQGGRSQVLRIPLVEIGGQHGWQHADARSRVVRTHHAVMSLIAPQLLPVDGVPAVQGIHRRDAQQIRGPQQRAELVAVLVVVVDVPAPALLLQILRLHEHAERFVRRRIHEPPQPVRPDPSFLIPVEGHIRQLWVDCREQKIRGCLLRPRDVALGEPLRCESVNGGATADERGAHARGLLFGVAHSTGCTAQTAPAEDGAAVVTRHHQASAGGEGGTRKHDGSMHDAQDSAQAQPGRGPRWASLASWP